MRSPVLAGALAALVLGAAAASALADTPDPSGPATLADALAQAQQQNKVLVIDFYTDW